MWGVRVRVGSKERELTPADHYPEKNVYDEKSSNNQIKGLEMMVGPLNVFEVLKNAVTSDGQGLTLEQFCSTLTLTLQNPYPSGGWRDFQGLQGFAEG